MIKTVVQNPVFRHTVTFWVGNLEDTISSLVYHLGNDAAENFKNFVYKNDDAVFIPDLEGFSLLWVRDGLSEVELISTLSHEIIHLVMTLLRDRNIPVSVENQETFAYLVGFYMEEFLKQLEKAKENGEQESTQLEG